MLKMLTRRLLLINFLVYAIALTTFSIAVSWFFEQNSRTEHKQRLSSLSRTLVTSIEAPDDDDEGPIPDLLQTHESTGQQISNNSGVGLQWFDDKARLSATKGEFPLNHPFNQLAKFEDQQAPHALILTEPVFRNKRLLGYLRVGMSLAGSDRAAHRLEKGLIFGTIFTLITTSVLVLWLVRQSLKPIEDSLRRLSDFTADASHELKGPITAIRTSGEVLLKYSTALETKDRERVEGMLSASRQMSSTISDLLSLATNDSEGIQLDSEPAELSNVVSEVADVIQKQTCPAAVVINTKLPETPCLIAMPSEDLNRVLHNLVKNAVQYSQGNESVEVVIEAKRIGEKVQIQVEDFGIGISEEDLPKIFDRFWRADKARSHSTGGNGLGLSIVQSFVHRYRGTITAQSKPGEGTTITILIPAYLKSRPISANSSERASMA